MLVFTDDGRSIESKLDINNLMQYGYMELRLIIEWARKVPGNITHYLHVDMLS